MDEPTDLKFCREVKNQKIFDTYLGIFQNLDQGPDGALKTVFPTRRKKKRLSQTKKVWNEVSFASTEKFSFTSNEVFVYCKRKENTVFVCHERKGNKVFVCWKRKGNEVCVYFKGKFSFFNFFTLLALLVFKST